MTEPKPYLSVIIPAYNEEDWLDETLKSIELVLQETDETNEVIVVDNNSDDRTSEVAREHGAEVVFEPENQIARARNAGAEKARGDWLLFLDADTLLPLDLVKEILRRTHEDDVIGGGSLLTFRESTSGFAVCGLEVWNWISRMLNLAAGSVFWVDSEAFHKVDGFNESVYASEELWISIALQRFGKKISRKFQIIPEPRARTSGRKFRDHSTLKLAGGFFLFFLAPWIVFSKRACSWYWYE